MEDRVDKSRGIVILIDESLTKIKPTEFLRVVKHVAFRKRKRSDSSDSSPAKEIVSR